MKCSWCKKEFEEKDIEEHHIHPRFMDNEKGNGKKTPLCKKCHTILHHIIPNILWCYIDEDRKKTAIDEVIKFTEEKTR